jgi:hypothetical protein
MSDDLHSAAHASLDSRLQKLESSILDVSSSLAKLEGRVFSAAAIGAILAGVVVNLIK